MIILSFGSYMFIKQNFFLTQATITLLEIEQPI